MREEKEIIYLREGFIQSIISDIVSISCVLLAFWINNKFIQSQILDIAMGILFFAVVLMKGGNKIHQFNSKEELLEYLKKE